MGADRKGPLAAFVVVAIVAAVLLITSVRSQAAPGFFDPPIPATIMAAPRAATGLLHSIDSDARQVAHQGLAVARKVGVPVSSDDSVTTASPATPTVHEQPTAQAGHHHHAMSGIVPSVVDPATHGHGPARPQHGPPSTHPGRHLGHDPSHHHSHASNGNGPADQSGDLGNHGLHLGWTANSFGHATERGYGHGEANPEAISKAAQAEAQAIEQDAGLGALNALHGKGHGYGHAYGHLRALTHGNALGRILP